MSADSHNEPQFQEIVPCSLCHDGVDAIGKTASHIASSENCKACHGTNVFTPVETVNHDEVIGSCETCHAPLANHVSAGVVSGCSNCHTATSWATPSSPLPVAGGN